MKIQYDADVDALYIRLGSQKPDGVIEISEGVGLDTTFDNKIVGIEILNASEKIKLKTLFSYQVQFDKKKIRKSA